MCSLKTILSLPTRVYDPALTHTNPRADAPTRPAHRANFIICSDSVWHLQHALPTWTPAWPMWIDSTSRMLWLSGFSDAASYRGSVSFSLPTERTTGVDNNTWTRKVQRKEGEGTEGDRARGQGEEKLHT